MKEINNMKTFQIIQDFGEGIKGFIYFDVPEGESLSAIEEEALKVQREDYKNRFSGWFGKTPEKKNLKVKEYCGKKHKPLKGGIQFKITWR